MKPEVRIKKKNIVRQLAEKWINTHQWAHKELTPEVEKAILKFAEFVDELMEQDK